MAQTECIELGVDIVSEADLMVSRLIEKCYRKRMRRALRVLRIVLMAYVAYGIIYQFPC